MNIQIVDQRILPPKPGDPDRHPDLSKMTVPDNVNHRIEDRAYRAAALEGTRPGTGLVSINISPGMNLGEFTITPQFETRPGERNECQTGQDALSLHSMDWLADILKNITGRGDWKVKVCAAPCGLAEKAPQVQLIGQVIEQRISVESALQQARGHDAEVMAEHGQSAGHHIERTVETAS